MFRINTSEGLVWETGRALEELGKLLGDEHHAHLDLYEVKAELNEPIRAKFSVLDDESLGHGTAIVVGDAVWAWDGQHWGAE